MSTLDSISISHPSSSSGSPPTRPFVRIALVLRLFFGILFELWGIHWRIRIYGPESVAPRLEALFKRQAVRFRQTAETMGGLLVKVGQFLSSRVDLLPTPFVQELQALQDNVKSSPWEEVEPIITADLGPVSTVFQSFDPEPLASASLGQVYRATSWSGEALAIKVQRPNINRIVGADLAAIRLVVAMTKRLTRFGKTFDLTALFEEFQHTVHQELDYLKEAQHAERIATECASMPWLHVPRVHTDFTTHRVLTMDLYAGFKVTDKKSLQAHHINRRILAERLIQVYLHMVMDVGFFHADPHPGNILIRPDSSIVLLDYGMVGEVMPAIRRQIRRLFVGISERRPSVVVDSLYALGILRPEASRRHLKLRVSYLLERYYAETLTDVQQLDLESLLHEIETLLRDEPIQFPAQFAFLGRAVSMLIGLATDLDPDINLVKLFAPYARRFVTDEAGGPVGYATRRAQDWLLASASLPTLSVRVLRQMEDGDLETGMHWPTGEEELRHFRRILSGLTGAIYATGFVAIGIWIRLLGWTLASDLAFAWAVAQLLWRWRRNRS